MTAPIATTQPSIGRFDRIQLALRVAVVVAGLAAVGSIRIAAADPEPALDLAIAVLVVVAALFPDGHAGLVVMAVVGMDWVLVVDDPVTPSVMALAATLASFHSLLALATVAPIGARLERATLQRWAGRTGLVVASVPPAWLAIVVADGLDLGASQLLVGAALLVVAVGAMWARRGNLW